MRTFGFLASLFVVAAIVFGTIRLLRPRRSRRQLRDARWLGAVPKSRYLFKSL